MGHRPARALPPFAKDPTALASLASASSASNFSHLLGLKDAASWAASASTSALSPSSWFENTVLKNAVASALGGEAVNWSALQSVSALPRDNVVRQTVSLLVLTYIGILVLYFTFAGLSYKYIFNKEMEKHPRFLKNQVKLEIQASMRAFLPLDFLTVPWFVLEVRGHSKLYNSISDYGWAYAVLSVPLFLVFTDFLIYWVHRIEHHPRLYKHVHKPHHKWLVPTPFASHAFHPLDGYAQSLPYHIFPFVFPLHRVVSIWLFVFVNLWSILIHDSDMICNSPLEKIINGPSHHTLHHSSLRATTASTSRFAIAWAARTAHEAGGRPDARRHCRERKGDSRTEEGRRKGRSGRSRSLGRPVRCLVQRR